MARTVPNPRAPAPAARDPDTTPLLYPVVSEALPDFVARTGGYVLSFARTPSDLDDILRLRFEVFNLELGEGLSESFQTGRDEDDLDRWFHHLLIRAPESGEVVGTYRMQTRAMAERFGGWYSAGEFDLDALPPEVLAHAVEVGRACVAKEHRNGRVLQLLWRGLAAYLSWNQKRFLFGCCSLTSQDCSLGQRTAEHLEAQGHFHPSYRVTPLPGLECRSPEEVTTDPVHIPALFQSYLSLGAQICGAPAIDRLFKTIDFLVILDIQRLDARIYQSFFG